MTEAEELELINIELEIRKRLQAELDPKIEAAKQPPSMQPLRDAAAGATVGPAKALGGLFDLFLTLPTNDPKSRLKPEDVEPYRLTPKINSMRDALAGREVGNSPLAAAAEGATGGLVFPGSKGLNMLSGAVSGGATQQALNTGASPAVAAGTGIAAGAGALIPAALKNVPTMLAGRRAERALSGSNQQDLGEALLMQQKAADRGLPLFPSQAMPTASPGMQQLETEILRSWSPAAEGAQQLGFKQAPMANWFAQSMLGKVLPTRSDLSTDQVAGNLAKAAQDRLKAGPEALNARTAGLYKLANESKEVIAGDDLKGVLQIIGDTKKKLGTTSDVAKVLTQVEGRLVKEAARFKGQIPAPRIYTIYQEFEKKLAEVNPAGVPTFSDKEAGIIRNTLNASLRDYLEKAEPNYALARELQASGRSSLNRNPFDQTEELAAAGGRAEAYLARVPEQGRAIAEISAGAPTKAGERLGANQEAARDALALSMQQRKDKAFQLSGAGEMMQNSPAMFVNSLIGTPEKKQSLALALHSVGLSKQQVTDLMEDMKVLGAAGRPTVVHGSRVPMTEISAIDVARASPLGGSLQQQQARMSILRSVVNLMSDKVVAQALEKPDSIAQLQRLAGAKAMEPRQALAALLAAQMQAQEGAR